MKDFKIETLVIPEINIKIGTWYLAKLLEEFNGDITLALAAYNGGRGNVREWLKSGQIRGSKEDNIPLPKQKILSQRSRKPINGTGNCTNYKEEVNGPGYTSNFNCIDTGSFKQE
nr:transglycosylase SLT domain-containing protein [Biomaibacter acetigenes]